MRGFTMDFYTFVLRQSAGYWIALCLENGVVGQGMTKDEAIKKLKEAISSIEMARQDEPDIYSTPICIKELHEFLAYEDSKFLSEPLELQALYA